MDNRNGCGSAAFTSLLFCEDFLDGAFYGKPIHEPPELFRGQFPGLIRGARPLEAVACIKSFCQEEHPVTFIYEAFDTVGAVAAEEEECPLLGRAQAVVQPDIGSQARDPFAQIDPAAAYDNAGNPDPFLKHGLAPA